MTRNLNYLSDEALSDALTLVLAVARRHCERKDLWRDAPDCAVEVVFEYRERNITKNRLKGI